MSKTGTPPNSLWSRPAGSAFNSIWSQYRDVLFPVVALMAMGTFFVPLQPAIIDLLVILNLVLTLIVSTPNIGPATA